MTKIQIKKLSNEVLTPKYETTGSSGMDIAAYIGKDIVINPGERVLIPTGFSLNYITEYRDSLGPPSSRQIQEGVPPNGFSRTFQNI